MLPYPQFPVDLVTFTEEILNGKRRFSYSVKEEGDGGVTNVHISVRRGRGKFTFYKHNATM